MDSKRPYTAFLSDIRARQSPLSEEKTKYLKSLQNFILQRDDKIRTSPEYIQKRARLVYAITHSEIDEKDLPLVTELFDVMTLLFQQKKEAASLELGSPDYSKIFADGRDKYKELSKKLKDRYPNIYYHFEIFRSEFYEEIAPHNQKESKAKVKEILNFDLNREEFKRVLEDISKGLYPFLRPYHKELPIWFEAIIAEAEKDSSLRVLLNRILVWIIDNIKYQNNPTFPLSEIEIKTFSPDFQLKINEISLFKLSKEKKEEETVEVKEHKHEIRVLEWKRPQVNSKGLSILYDEKVNLEKYPEHIDTLTEEELDSDDILQFTIGDLHGNVLKEIYFFIKRGSLILDLDPVEAAKKYERLVAIYKKFNQLVRDGDKEGAQKLYNEFKSILKEGFILSNAILRPKHKILFRFIGDTVADRGGFSRSNTKEVLEHLKFRYERGNEYKEPSENEIIIIKRTRDKPENQFEEFEFWNNDLPPSSRSFENETYIKIKENKETITIYWVNSDGNVENIALDPAQKKEFMKIRSSSIFDRRNDDERDSDTLKYLTRLIADSKKFKPYEKMLVRYRCLREKKDAQAVFKELEIPFIQGLNAKVSSLVKDKVPGTEISDVIRQSANRSAEPVGTILSLCKRNQVTPGNDLFQYSIPDVMAETGAPFEIEIIRGNHEAENARELDEALENPSAIIPTLEKSSGDFPTVSAVGSAIEADVIRREEVRRLYKQYTEHYKLYSYSYTDGPPKKMAIFRHGPAGHESLQSVAEQYGIPFDIRSNQSIRDMIDAINQKHAYDMITRRIEVKDKQPTNSRSLIVDPVQGGISRELWSRVRKDPFLYLPKQLPDGTFIDIVHGHDGETAEGSPSNLISIDSDNGKDNINGGPSKRGEPTDSMPYARSQGIVPSATKISEERMAELIAFRTLYIKAKQKPYLFELNLLFEAIEHANLTPKDITKIKDLLNLIREADDAKKIPLKSKQIQEFLRKYALSIEQLKAYSEIEKRANVFKERFVCYLANINEPNEETGVQPPWPSQLQAMYNAQYELYSRSLQSVFGEHKSSQSLVDAAKLCLTEIEKINSKAKKEDKARLQRHFNAILIWLEKSITFPHSYCKLGDFYAIAPEISDSYPLLKKAILDFHRIKRYLSYYPSSVKDQFDHDYKIYLDTNPSDNVDINFRKSRFKLIHTYVNTPIMDSGAEDSFFSWAVAMSARFVRKSGDYDLDDQQKIVYMELFQFFDELVNFNYVLDNLKQAGKILEWYNSNIIQKLFEKSSVLPDSARDEITQLFSILNKKFESLVKQEQDALEKMGPLASAVKKVLDRRSAPVAPVISEAKSSLDERAPFILDLKNEDPLLQKVNDAFIKALSEKNIIQGYDESKPLSPLTWNKFSSLQEIETKIDRAVLIENIIKQIVKPDALIDASRVAVHTGQLIKTTLEQWEKTFKKDKPVNDVSQSQDHKEPISLQGPEVSPSLPSSSVHSDSRETTVTLTRPSLKVPAEIFDFAKSKIEDTLRKYGEFKSTIENEEVSDQKVRTIEFVSQSKIPPVVLCSPITEENKLQQLLPKVMGLQREKSNTVFFIPLILSYPQDHWTILIIHNKKAFLCDPRYGEGVEFSSDTIERILKEKGIGIELYDHPLDDVYQKYIESLQPVDELKDQRSVTSSPLSSVDSLRSSPSPSTSPSEDSESNVLNPHQTKLEARLEVKSVLSSSSVSGSPESQPQVGDRPKDAKHRFTTINVAMLPFRYNRSFLESVATRAAKLAKFLNTLDSDIIFTQELFGFGLGSGDTLFIREMDKLGYGVEKGPDRSGVAIFYKKGKVAPIRTLFKPHLRVHRHSGLETKPGAEKGLLIAQFEDITTKEVITAVDTHLTGGLGFPYREESIRLHGSTSKKRAEQIGHASKILKHMHKVTPKNTRSSYTVFGADINQDINWVQNAKGEWVRQIGVSSGKPKKSGLREFPAGVTKYPEFIEFFDGFNPVIPKNLKPKKVIPSKRKRLDDIVHEEKESKQSELLFSGTDIGEATLRSYAREHGGSIIATGDESEEFHDYVEKKSSGKMIDVLALNSASHGVVAETRIVGTKRLSDHQAIVMDIKESKERERDEKIINPLAQKYYFVLANLKWSYLKRIEDRSSIFYDEEKTMLRIDVLNRLLDSVEALCNRKLDRNITKQHIVAEVSKAILYAASDDQSSDLIGLLEGFLFTYNLRGIDFTDSYITEIEPREIKPPVFEKKEPSELLSAEQISDQLVQSLTTIQHNYEYHALSLLAGREKKHIGYLWHHHLQELESLIKALRTPHLVEGQPCKALSQWSSEDFLIYAEHAVKKSIRAIGTDDPILGKDLSNLHKALKTQVHLILPGYHLYSIPYQPARRDLEDHIIYLYQRSDSTLECLFKDQHGEIQQIKVVNSESDTTLISDIQKSLRETGNISDEKVQRRLFQMLMLNTENRHVTSLIPEDEKKLSAKLHAKQNHKLIEQLRHTIAKYESIRLEQRTTGGDYFRNENQTEMRQMVLGNMLNYLERQLKTNPLLKYDQFQQLVSEEVQNALLYINADHCYGQSRIHLFLPTQSDAYVLLEKFQREHHLFSKRQVEDAKAEVPDPKNISEWRDRYVDQLRNIKRSYYVSVEDKKISRSEFRNNWGTCYALEQLIQNLMQHPLQTHENGQLRPWTQNELEQYINVKWKKLSEKSTRNSLIDKVEDMFVPLNLNRRGPIKFNI